tara:strand:- start:388 stop:642 length:255 start_codon:yes stop_codon:yes gene_type:complete
MVRTENQPKSKPLFMSQWIRPEASCTISLHSVAVTLNECGEVISSLGIKTVASIADQLNNSLLTMYDLGVEVVKQVLIIALLLA